MKNFTKIFYKTPHLPWIIFSTAALLSYTPAAIRPSDAAPVPADAVVVHHNDDGMNIEFSDEFVQIANKDPESLKDRVLDIFWRKADAFKAMEEQSSTTTEGARTLKGAKAKKAKTPKSSKTVAPAPVLSAECRQQDEYTPCALEIFLSDTAMISIQTSFLFGEGKVLNSTSCDVTDTTAVCNFNVAPWDTFNSTECLDYYGGQVTNTNITVSILNTTNVTSIVVANLPFCIPATCDHPIAFAAFASDIASMAVVSNETIGRRTNRRLVTRCGYN